MKSWGRILFVLMIVVTVAELTYAQQRRRGGRLPPSTERYGIPTWDLHPTMPKDVFTFARVRYTSFERNWRWGGAWYVDYRDADLNFSYRLNEMTSLKTDPEGTVIDLADPALFDLPFIYLIEPGAMVFSEEEVAALRTYLLSGGFLMVDDFWGDYEWENFEREIKRVLPAHAIEDLPPDHAIFNLVFKLPPSPQIPNIRQGMESQFNGVTWEPDKEPGARTPHYRAIFDDLGRPMVIICHNTDLGDGWEREGENEYYFREFSEKIAYPLGINILLYALTH